MHTGLHHAERKHKEGAADAFDRFMIAVGIIGPLSLAPQVMKIWNDKSVAGLSLPTWILLTIVSFMWVLYGLRHKSNALVVANIVAVVMNLLVVCGFFLFR